MSLSFDKYFDLYFKSDMVSIFPPINYLSAKNKFLYKIPSH